MIDILKKYHDDGYLHKQVHPTLDLTIWNYTILTKSEKYWDNITLMCRGLVTNSKGEIVARPFQKFFNLHEIPKENLPNIGFDVYEKVDGSLGILFNYEDQWVFVSRGSFTSEYALKGWELLQKYNYTELPKDCTYLFEIIYPENRIVVNYGDQEKLVLTGCINTKTGHEYSIHDDFYLDLGFEIVKKYSTLQPIEKLIDHIPEGNEGFVIRFKNGFRVKIKSDEYVRLHRIITNTSNRDIWLALKYGDDLSKYLENVPDEFHNWVIKHMNMYNSQFHNYKKQFEKEFKLLVDKKEFSEKIKDNPFKHVLFKRLVSYSTEYDEMIWDLIYPDFYYKAFKNKE